MAEISPLPVSSSTHTACDLCHTRKIRCDRQDPCDRCTSSGSQCLRTRHISRTRRRRRPWLNSHHGLNQTGASDPVNLLPDRPWERVEAHGSPRECDQTPPRHITTLSATAPSRCISEASPAGPPGRVIRTVGIPAAPSPAARLGVHAERHSTLENGRRGHQRTASSEVPSSQHPDAQPQDTRLHHAASDAYHSPIAAGYEAHAYLERVLAENDSLGSYERDVLQVALDSLFRGGGASPARSPMDGEASEPDHRDLSDPSMYPSEEVVCFVSTGSRTVAGAFYSELTSFISKDSFERMAYSVLDGSAQGFIRAEYLVCINFFMLTSVGLEETDHSEFTKARLRLLRERYRKNALKALESVSVCSPPSLSLLQALLSGAMLFQMAGNIDRCAQLSSSACLVVTHLGGRYLAERAASTSVQDSLEVRQCLGHCYIIDKALAMSLGRRSFLPDMDVNATMLIPVVPEMPSSPVSNIYLQFAKVRDEIAREMRAQQGGLTQGEREVALRMVHSLRLKMETIRSRSFEYRSQWPQCTDLLLKGEWMGVDFTYYSIMTAITRLHPSFNGDRVVRDMGLEDARRALHALRDMQRHGLNSGKVWNAYCLSITWVLLLCPTCPFLILFCHIVADLDKGDLGLLTEVTQGLAGFKASSAAMGNVMELLDTFVSLSKEHLATHEGLELDDP